MRRPVTSLAVQGDLVYVGLDWNDYRREGYKPLSLQVWKLEERKSVTGAHR